ncbi:MAG: peptidoglycan-binding domain-containing protein [Candidatus Omnitrophica bacterium]|nr:peptidoglycan-binding domain-containing protein [Candidatus Omnitrophota bacterium]
MNKRFLVIILVAMVVVPLAIFGCKAKADKPETPETSAAMPMDTMAPAADTLAIQEPSQLVATETIPPSAAPQLAEQPAQTQAIVQAGDARVKDIQRALKNAGFYTASIDGKLGPKTKSAIEEFQRANGLKVDGKVGPITWAELEKYLVQQ